jgi:hypothetical protein
MRGTTRLPRSNSRWRGDRTNSSNLNRVGAVTAAGYRTSAAVCPTKPKAVSNNHFDEDGLAGIFTMLQPTTALRHRDLVLDVTQADDFGVYVRREAARIVVLPLK